MGKLSNKIALITGASEGIGFAIAQRFLLEDAEHVFIFGRRQEVLDDAVKQFVSTNVTTIQGDVSNLDDLAKLYDTIRKYQNRLDIVVANAGVTLLGPLGSITEQEYYEVFDINVKGVLFTVQKSLSILADSGSIILIGSVSSVKGHSGTSIYSASKAAIRSFARCWAMDLKERNIRVNTLSPGTIETTMFKFVIDSEITSTTFLDDILKKIPMGRLGASDEVARAAVFLASDDSSYITGIELFVDGGRGQI